MQLSQLMAHLTATLTAHGDMPVYINDMKPINEGHIDVVKGEPEMMNEVYGPVYLHLGEW
jgi:hypothetical protein